VGAVYVFERNAAHERLGTGEETTAPMAWRAICSACRSRSGDVTIVGAMRRVASGAAYVFERNAGGTNPGVVKKLTAEDGTRIIDSDARFGAGM